jgi:hypothetical protein
MIEPLEHRIAPANLAFAVGVGALGNQTITEIATDSAGNIYVAGTFKGTVDFDPGEGIANRTAEDDDRNAFVAKYTGLGALAWVNVIHYSDGLALAPEIAASENGDVFIASSYGATPSTTVQFFEGESDAPSETLFQPGQTSQSYAVKLDTTGRFLWAQSFGTGAGFLTASDIAVGPAGTIYLAGNLSNRSSPGAANIGGFSISSDAGEADLYVIRLQDGPSATVIWVAETSSVTTLAQIAGPKLIVDSAGRAVIAGAFNGQFNFGGAPVTSQSFEDFYVARLSTNGQVLPQADYLFSLSVGGGSPSPGKDELGLAFDESESVVIAGKFSGTRDFNPSSGIAEQTAVGGTDLFAAKYDTNGNFVDVNVVGGMNDEKFLGLARVGTSFVLAGTFENAIDIQVIDNTASFVSTGPDDAMLISLSNGLGITNAQRIAMENGASGSGLFAASFEGGGFALTGLADGSLAYGGAFRGVFDADTGTAVKNLKSKGGSDIFLARFLPEGVTEQPLFQPALALSAAIGGAGDQVGMQVITDAAGRIYIAGAFKGVVDFDPSSAATNLTSSDPGGNYFIAQYNPDGTLRWVRQVATILPDQDVNVKLALNVSGDAYLAGVYETSATIGTFTLTNADASGRTDVFLARYNLNGNADYAVSIGGAGGDEFLSAFACDPSSGRTVLGGTFASTTDFDPGGQTAFRSPNGGPGTVNSFVLSLGVFGDFQWVHQIAGAPGFGEVTAIGFLNNIDVVVAGDFTGTVDLDFGNSPVTVTSDAGNDDVFLVKYDGISGSITASTAFVAPNSQGVRSIVVTPDNEIFVGGEFSGIFTIDAFPVLISAGGEGDAFVLKLDSSFGVLANMSFGGAGGDFIGALGLDNEGSLVVTGRFSQTVDFDPGAGVARLTSSNLSNIFVARYDTSTLQFRSAFRIDAFDPEEENGSGINMAAGGEFHVDAGGNFYLTGGFNGSVDIDIGAGVRKLTSKGGLDLFFAKFSPVNLADAGHSRTFRDVDGDEITLKLTGPGSLVYTLDGGAGDFANAALIELTGTTLASTFTITVKQAGNGDGTTAIDIIRTTGVMQHLGAVFLDDGVLIGDGSSDLVPDFLITGASRTLKLGDLNANAYVKLGQDLPYNAPGNATPDTYNHHPDLTIDTVVDNGAVVEVTGDGNAGGVGGGGLGKLVVGSWASPGFIRTTQSIGSLLVLRDNFMATLQVDAFGVGEETTATMGSITVQNGAWGSSGNEVEGSIGSFNAEAFLLGASITAGSIGSVKITDGNFAGELKLTDPVANGTNVFTVNSNFTGSIETNAPLKSLKIKGTFAGSLTAPTIGAITAFSFVGTIEGSPLFHSITTTAGPLGVLKSTVAAIKDYTLDTEGGFGGISVKLSKLTTNTIGLDNVSIKAASIGKINVSLSAAKTAAGIELIGIRGSAFITKGTATKGVLRGNIGAISVSLSGTAGGGDAMGIRSSIFDARVDAGEFMNPAASSVNLLTSVKVTIKGQDGTSGGIESSAFLGDSIGKTKVSVSRGKAGTSAAFGLLGTSFAADEAIGAMTFDGDTTVSQVSGLTVIAGASIGALTVKAKNAALGSLENSAILAGQLLALTGDDNAVKAALAKSNLGAVKVSGSLTNTNLIAGASIGAVSVGGAMTASLVLAGAKLGGDTEIDGDETYQRAASIAAVTVGGAVASSSIVAGVNPVNGVFGDADDTTAAAAGVLEDTSRIGAINFSGLEGVLANANLTNHQFSVQAAAIKSLKTASEAFSDFTVAQFLDVGVPGEDAGDLIIRLR